MRESQMKIDFYIPQDKAIPTELRLKVDGQYDVYYEKFPYDFAYRFSFLKSQGITLEMARTIVDEIVSRMIDQSYDHGAQWKEHWGRDFVENDYEIQITAFFRVRDAD